MPQALKDKSEDTTQDKQEKSTSVGITNPNQNLDTLSELANNSKDNKLFHLQSLTHSDDSKSKLPPKPNKPVKDKVTSIFPKGKAQRPPGAIPHESERPSASKMLSALNEAPTLDQSKNTREYLEYCQKMKILARKLEMDIDQSTKDDIWVTCMKILFHTESKQGLGNIRNKKTNKVVREGVPKDVDHSKEYFAFNFDSDAFQELIHVDFLELANKIDATFGETFNKGKIFGFWSKVPAMQVGKSTDAIMLETSAYGQPFDDINITGGWNIQLWGAISHYYATAAAKKISEGGITYWGFVGDGATGDVDNIYAKIEKKAVESIAGQYYQGDISEMIFWHGCMSLINEKGEKIEDGKVPNFHYNKEGIEGVLLRDKNRHHTAKSVEEETKEIISKRKMDWKKKKGKPDVPATPSPFRWDTIEPHPIPPSNKKKYSA